MLSKVAVQDGTAPTHEEQALSLGEWTSVGRRRSELFSLLVPLHDITRHKDYGKVGEAAVGWGTALACWRMGDMGAIVGEHAHGARGGCGGKGAARTPNKMNIAPTTRGMIIWKTFILISAPPARRPNLDETLAGSTAHPPAAARSAQQTA